MIPEIFTDLKVMKTWNDSESCLYINYRCAIFDLSDKMFVDLLNTVQYVVKLYCVRHLCMMSSLV